MMNIKAQMGVLCMHESVHACVCVSVGGCMHVIDITVIVQD